MAAKFICDGCGKEELAISNGRDWVKPRDWYQRSDDQGIQDACCRECISFVTKKTGKTDVIIPI